MCIYIYVLYIYIYIYVCMYSVEDLSIEVSSIKRRLTVYQ